MPFGLCNAPATFERLMERVLGQLQWQICLCYLDDILIFSKTVDDHLKHLDSFPETVSSQFEAQAKEVPFLSTTSGVLGSHREPRWCDDRS